MNIQQLEYLIAVDKYKHFGNAAQSCFITQPTLSAMIQKFEEELNVKVFDRTSHPIRTTDMGLEIIKQAKIVIDGVMELRNKADELNNILGGTLNLGIIPTVSGCLIPTEIFDFISANKSIKLNVKEMTTDNVLKAVKSGELDAGIISTPYDGAEEFFQTFIFNEELMVYSALEQSDKKESFVIPEKIDVDKVWLLEEGNCLRNQFEKICHLKENSTKPKNLDFLAGNISTLIHMVDKMGGLTILPEIAVEQLSDLQRKNVARFVKPFPYREISIIYYKPTYKQKIIDELVSFIQHSLSSKLNYYKNPADFVSIKAK